MKKYNNILIFLSSLLIISVFVGCRRDLNYRKTTDDGLVKINLKWQDGVTAPKSVKYAFYNENGQFFKEKELAANITFEDRFPKGKYTVVIHNTDALNVSHRGMDKYLTAEVFTNPVTRATEFITEPSNVFGIGKCNEFAQIVVNGNDTVSGTATPVALTKKVRILFKIVNVHDVLSVDGSISGVVKSILLSSIKPNIVDASSIGIQCQPVDAANTQFNAQVEVFGLVTLKDSPSNTNVVNLTLNRTGGKNSFAVDVTDVVKDLITENGGEIPIEIPVEISVTLTPIGTFDVTVTEWDQNGSGSGEFNQ